MGDGFIVRRGKVTEQALAPSIITVETTEISFKFAIKNEDSEKAIIRYRINDITDEGEIFELNSGQISEEIEVTGLTGETLTTIFANANVTGKIKSEVTAKVITTDDIVIAYGVQWDQSTDTVTRIQDAVGLSRSDFDTIEPWASMRRCMVNDDLSINYYIDPDDPDNIGEVVNTGSYTTGDPADYTGGDGQVMVEIPKFYYKTAEPSSNVYQWYISSEPKIEYDVHPAFVTSGQTREKVYIGAFEATISNNVMQSVSGIEVAGGSSLSSYRTLAQARGTGWQMQTYRTTQALQVLYLIEYADFDSQTTIGRGASSGPFSPNLRLETGLTISAGNTSTGTQEDGISPMSYRGIENLFASMGTYIDGINFSGSSTYVANEDFASGVITSPYVFLGNVSGGNGYITNILFPEFLPTALGGSSTSHLHDGYLQSGPEGNYGGNTIDGSGCGIFKFETRSGGNRFYGTRIQIL